MTNPAKPHPLRHWHFSDDRSYTGDTPDYVTYSVVDLLSVVHTELVRQGEFEFESITTNGEAGDYRDAYDSFVRSQEYENIAANVDACIRAASLSPADRPPLYRDEAQYGPLWTKNFEYVRGLIENAPWPRVDVYWCERPECMPGQWLIEHGGDFVTRHMLPGSWVADDYRAAFTELRRVMTEWAEESDDHAGDEADHDDVAMVGSLFSRVDGYTYDSVLTSPDRSLTLHVNANDGATYWWRLFLAVDDDDIPDERD